MNDLETEADLEAAKLLIRVRNEKLGGFATSKPVRATDAALERLAQNERNQQVKQPEHLGSASLPEGSSESVHIHLHGPVKPAAPRQPVREVLGVNQTRINAILARTSDSQPMNFEQRNTFKTLPVIRTSDARSAEMLYRRLPNGQLVPVEGGKGERSISEVEATPTYSREELPDFVSRETSLAASCRGVQPWGIMPYNASGPDQITRTKAVNAAQAEYYENASNPGKPQYSNLYGPNYGKTGKTDGDYGTHFVSREGKDQTPSRNSPPPPSLTEQVQFEGDSPMGPAEIEAERFFGNGNGRPYRGDDPNRRAVSQGETNWGIESLEPGTVTRFNPPSAENHSHQAMDDARSLRAWNNRNRKAWKDDPLSRPIIRDKLSYPDPELFQGVEKPAGVHETDEGKVEIEDLKLHPRVK